MRRLLLFASALFGFMACTQNPIEEQSAIRTDAPETLRVGFEDDETRIQLNEAQKTVWTKDDLVSVFYRSDANQKWQYQGETGERVGDLKRVENATSTTKTTKTVVVYPYSESYWLNTDSYAIDATLPATQHYAEGSYGVGSNLMVSQSEFTQFSLKSVCGWLKLRLTGDGAVVKSIKFRGNDGEQVAGLIYVDTATAKATLASEMGGTDDNNAGGNLVFDDTILTEVVLDCGEGVTLGAEATPFYISLPPQTFANGFTVEIECKDYELMTLTTEKELVIERNHIQPMARVEHDAKQIIPNNEIWYTNGSTTEATTPYNTNAFSANIVSNTYDAAKECWIIKFDGKVTTIGDAAFAYCSSLTSVTIPDSVTAIGYAAFAYCSSLTSVIIGDGVTTIGDGAFYECYSLTSVTIPDSVTSIGYAAFYYCASLTSVIIGDSVTTIGESAFENCISLESVYISDIAAWCNISFSGSSSNPLCCARNLYLNNELVTDLIIPNSVTTIGNNAFSGCSNLTSVTIPDSVTTIGERAFEYCSSLQEFKGKFASEDGRCLIIDGTLNAFAPAGLTEYTIPDSVTTIGDYAFCDCSSLTSITIPDSVTIIGYRAFYGCTGELIIYSKIIETDYTNNYPSIDGWLRGAKFTKLTIGDGIEKIGNRAFCKCSSLTSVTIPDSVTTIGYGVFAWCSNLQEFRGEFTSEDGRCLIIDGTLNAFAPAGLIEYAIPDSVTMIEGFAFEGCCSLTSVTVPNSVTSIGYEAFSHCESLTSVTIGDSVTTIGSYAFGWCESLTSVYCKATIPPSLGDSAFSYNANGRRIYVYEECVEVYKSAWSIYKDSIYTNGQNGPDTTTIEYTTTDGNTITSSKLPIISNSYDNGVGKMIIGGIITVIPDSAFKDCESLTSVTIPDSVTSIGNWAFNGCDSLTSVIIGDSVTSIGYGAFAYCSSLTSVTIGDSVTTIGKSAFSHCSSLTSVTIGDSVTTIGDLAFLYCSSLTSVTIPDSVTSIEEGAFALCSNLQEFKGKFASKDGRCLIIDGVLNSFAIGYGATEYTIPDSVTMIGHRAFFYCSSLTSVTIPNSITSIGYWAFEGCSSLTSVTIPDSVTTIGSNAFYDCSSLTSVYCKAATPPVGDDYMFEFNAEGRKIYVPMESVEAYKNKWDWSDYASAIVGYNF